MAFAHKVFPMVYESVCASEAFLEIYRRLREAGLKVLVVKGADLPEYLSDTGCADVF